MMMIVPLGMDSSGTRLSFLQWFIQQATCLVPPSVTILCINILVLLSWKRIDIYGLSRSNIPLLILGMTTPSFRCALELLCWTQCTWVCPETRNGWLCFDVRWKWSWKEWMIKITTSTWKLIGIGNLWGTCFIGSMHTILHGKWMGSLCNYPSARCVGYQESPQSALKFQTLLYCCAKWSCISPMHASISVWKRNILFSKASKNRNCFWLLLPSLYTME